MKKFTFRLETLLRLRKKQEDERKAALGAAQRRVRDLFMELDRLHEERERLEKEWSARLSGTQNAGSLRAFEEFRTHLFRRTEHTQIELDAAQAELDEARRKLSEAMRKVASLENLRDRHEARHRATALKQEQDMLDESATMRFARADAAPHEVRP
ncbi:MAG: flagellar export protein FliJ [Planctomycetota bacterium]|nr:flagellar export protein FliJ [Planctomycetota bacterium]